MVSISINLIYKKKKKKNKTPEFVIFKTSSLEKSFWMIAGNPTSFR